LSRTSLSMLIQRWLRHWSMRGKEDEQATQNNRAVKIYAGLHYYTAVRHKGPLRSNSIGVRPNRQVFLPTYSFTQERKIRELVGLFAIPSLAACTSEPPTAEVETLMVPTVMEKPLDSKLPLKHLYSLKIRNQDQHPQPHLYPGNLPRHRIHQHPPLSHRGYGVDPCR